MPVRRRTLLALAFVAAVAGWAVLEALSVTPTGLLYEAPALLLALPLLLGRYVGEERIAALVARAPRLRRRRPARATAPVRTVVRVMQRGGRLVAASLAKRPPPAPGLSLP